VTLKGSPSSEAIHTASLVMSAFDCQSVNDARGPFGTTTKLLKPLEANGVGAVSFAM
jgi:hypothetical protein